MSNSDAHAMLRSAGPVLKLGLNEDRELSPRRRSIGKATELKRPSQLISEINSGRATPQAPVYATIRPPQSPHNKLSSPIRSLNSPLSTLNSTPLVKSVAPPEEPIKFHPTNPFYSTLPNYTSTSKLPIPNGKATNSQALLYNRSINKSTDSYSKNGDHELKLSSFFSKKFDSGPSSITNTSYDMQVNNSFETTSPKSLVYDKYSSLSDSQIKSSELRKSTDFEDSIKNPFESSKESNLGNKYSSGNKVNGTSTNGSKQLLYSKSDSDFRLNEEVIKHSSITEQKINEIEEIKTIKKITLNGSTDNEHNQRNGLLKERTSSHNGTNERIIPTTLHNEDFYSKVDHQENSNGCNRTPTFQSSCEEHNVEDQSDNVVLSRPVEKSPGTPSQATTPISKRSNITKEDVNQNNAEVVKENSENLSNACESLSLDVNSEIDIQKSDETKTKEKSDDSLVSPTYIVETPEQAVKIKPKLDNGMKSKSCDNDDSPTIVEITEDVNTHSDDKTCAPIIDSSNIVISNEETNIEWENVDDFKSPQRELIEGVLSSTTIPLNIAHCEHTKTLSPEEESSLRNYLQTLNLSTNGTNFNAGDITTEIEQIINREIKYRLRRKGFAEDNLYPRAGPSRSLAVIDEEGSSDSSKTSRRQSYLSEKKSDNEELEDEVFESKQVQVFPSGSTDIISKTSRHLIPQECIRVDAKLREPEISEARGDWTVKTVEKMTGAELIYLTDSSSSTSSIYDANDDISKGEETDTSVRIITPTIEVTDTETLLSSTFATKTNSNNVNKPQENNLNDTTRDIKQLINNNDSSNYIKKCDFSTDSHLNGNSHEIVILSTDNLRTNLFVKDIEDKNIEIDSEKDYKNDDQIKIITKSPNEIDEYDLEIKVLKCELNDAINNLIKEVTSDSENSNENSNDTFKRQDSSSSVDSSQCTAKYNPTNSSLNDVSNLIQDEECVNTNKKSEINSTSSHVKDVIQCITTKPPLNEKNINNKNTQPLSLRDTCLKKITSFPFGDKILEELANVSQRLQNTVLASQSKENIPNKPLSRKENCQIPPPIQPRKSSLKITQDEQNKPVLPSQTESVYECLSPSQKMLMEKTNTVIGKDDIAPITEPYVSETEVKLNNIDDKSFSGISVEKLPMKSKTGSRLLALLRDTSNSPKLNSPSVSNTNSQSPRVKFNSESYSKKLMEEIDSIEIPVPKKYFPPISSDNYKSIRPQKSNNTSYFYESDSGIREDSFQTLHSNRKYFHYSTGNLSKEIESDISSIQNMHRYCTNLRDQKREDITPRRPSLPKDLCDQQMEYIRQKEKEVDAEIRRLEQERNKTVRHRGPRAPMFSEKENTYDQIFDSRSRNSIKNFAVHQNPMNSERRKVSSLFSSSEEELLREKMYSEYVNQMAEREQRKQQKVIKITQTPTSVNVTSKSMPALETLNSMNNRIEQEFISKAKERWYKLGIKDPETEDEQEKKNNVYREPKVIEHKIKVIESGEEKDVRKLPSHMQEFVRFTVNDKDDEKGNTGESDSEQASAHVVVFCAVVILVLTVGKFLLRLLRNQ